MICAHERVAVSNYQLSTRPPTPPPLHSQTQELNFGLYRLGRCAWSRQGWSCAKEHCVDMYDYIEALGFLSHLGNNRKYDSAVRDTPVSKQHARASLIP